MLIDRKIDPFFPVMSAVSVRVPVKVRASTAGFGLRGRVWSVFEALVDERAREVGLSRPVICAVHGIVL